MNQNITDIPNWVCWTKMARDNGKVGKMPINPKTGRGAKTNDASTWGTYAEACAAKQTKGYDGIGFEFTNSGLVGIDLDDCIEEDGALSPLSSHLVESISSYTELSPSGKGLHILVASELPDGSLPQELKYLWMHQIHPSPQAAGLRSVHAHHCRWCRSRR